MKKNKKIYIAAIILIIISLILKLLYYLYINRITELDFSMYFLYSYIFAFASLITSIFSVIIDRKKISAILLIMNIILFWLNIYLFFNTILEGLRSLANIG